MKSYSVLLVCATVLLVTHTHGRSIDREEQLSKDDSGALLRAKLLFKNVVKRFVNANPDTAPLTRVKRSLVLTIENRCISNTDCTDSSMGNVSLDLAHCDTNSGLCVCSECFVRLNNTCQVIAPLCRDYSSDSEECVDQRRSQKITFFLSMFLSSVGAANFYIGDYVLGGVQLGLFVLCILLIIAAASVPCCVICWDLDDEEELYSITLFILFLIVVILTLCVIACWWVADLAIFAYNGRVGLNGCSLVADL